MLALTDEGDHHRRPLPTDRHMAIFQSAFFERPRGALLTVINHDGRLHSFESPPTTPPRQQGNRPEALDRKQVEARQALLEERVARLERLQGVPAPIDGRLPSATKPANTPRLKWTAEELGELEKYRAKHGATAAAEKFGISTGRIRQLLPGKRQSATRANDPFGFGSRRR